MRLTRRTFLMSTALSACGGTAGVESLGFFTPQTPTETTPLPIDPRCCQPIDGCQTSPALPGIPKISSTAKQRFFLTLTGQSNATGRTPAVTRTQPFSNQRGQGPELLPLVEVERETIKSAAANMLTHLSGDRAVRVVAHVDAASGTEYQRLKKGSAPYTRILRQLNASKTKVASEEETLRALAVLVVHGENDHVFRNPDYAANLREWQNDFDTDMRTATGQSEAVPMFTDQLSSFTTYGDATSAIPIAQLTASIQNPHRIFLVGPKYQYTYEDGKHLLPAHLQWLGEQYGKVMKRVFIDGEAWRPLSPKEIRRGDSKKTLRVLFHVPSPPIVFDTARVPAKEKMGFELAHPDPSIRLPSIEHVVVSGADTVELTLSGELPDCSRLRYAFTGTPGALAGASGPRTEGSARGNLRDSDSTPSFHADWALHNWCCTFDAPVI